MNNPLLSHLAPFLLRLVFGVIFVTHGVMKFLPIDGTIQFFTSLGVPLPAIAAPAVALIEIVGGIALILGLGLGTRILALLLAVVMLAATLMVKSGAGFVGGYEFELALLAGLLAIAFGGSGRWSLIREKAVPATA